MFCYAVRFLSDASGKKDEFVIEEKLTEWKKLCILGNVIIYRILFWSFDDE